MSEAPTENVKKELTLTEVEQILRSKGIEMQVDGCGCCGSPTVFFKYEDREFYDDRVDLNTHR